MSQKTRVLVFIDWFLPGYKAGGPIRSVANMVEHLKEDVEFEIITSDRDWGDTEPYLNIKTNTLIEKDGYKITYLSPESRTREKILELLRSRSFEIVYFNSFFSKDFTLIPLRILNTNFKSVKVVLAPRGMLGQGALGLKSIKKRLFILFSKAIKLYDSVVWHSTGDDETVDIQSIFPNNSKIVTVSNISWTPVVSKKMEKIEHNLKIVFLSRISEKKNLHFAIDVLSKITSLAKIQFDVFGPVEDKFYWEKCLTLTKNLPQNIQFEYKGAVNHQLVYGILQNYHLFFLPTLHENFGHAINESLAAGCPVLLSDQTPWRNLQQHNAGWDIPLDKPEEFVKIIEYCAKLSQEDYDKMSLAAQNFAMSRSDLSATIKKYLELFSS